MEEHILSRFGSEEKYQAEVLRGDAVIWNQFWDSFVAKQNSRAVDTLTQYSATYQSPRRGDYSSHLLSPRSTLASPCSEPASGSTGTKEASPNGVQAPGVRPHSSPPW